MLDKKVDKLLSEQITKEIYSAYLYLGMANYYNEEGLSGFENWYYVQAQEEMDHAMLFRAYLLNNDGKIKLQAIDAPSGSYKAFDEPLKASLKHEQFVTKSINAIYEAAMADKDYRTIEFLSWFIEEQGEEEKNATDLLKKFELFGDSMGLYQLDKELLGRSYSPPSLKLD